MSQQQWGLPAKPGGGGSVRRARERMEAGLPPMMPHPPPPQKEELERQKLYALQENRYEQPRAAPMPGAPASPPSQVPRTKPQMPAGVAPRNGQGPIGVAISRPTQVPQWPLAGTIDDIQEQPVKFAPQRPPRPSQSRIPSMLDPSRAQDLPPTFQYKPATRGPMMAFQDDDDYDDEGSSDDFRSPVTPSSRPSTVSSVGTIPDFPVPMMPPPVARRSANLGPPPTSRRGASAYYSNASFVSPIPEESPRSQPSHQSYASSAAMPSYWDSGVESPGYSDYDEKFSPRSFGNDVIDERGESRESNFDDNDDGRGLIRSASIGKKAKPTIISTKSSERIDPRPAPVPQQLSKLERMGIVASGVGAGQNTEMTALRMQQSNMWPMIAGDLDSPLASGTGLIDKSNSSSETTVPGVALAVTTDDRSSLPPPNAYGAKGAMEMLGAYNAASSLAPTGEANIPRTPSPGYSRFSAIRRPPKLDIDAVRNAEARGSLTSLPDLIRRATRLAAMMDRGRRPASHVGMDDFPPNELDGGVNVYPDDKRQSGLSGMLAAFPPAGLGTPTRETTQTPRPLSQWPRGDYDQSTTKDENNQPRKRRCCGLPLCGFFFVLLIVLIIIAAAVVVPLELLVIHKKAVTPGVSALQACATDTTTECQNGGSTFLTDSVCGCICINGFTGATCAVGGTTGCTTATLSTALNNVTLGDSIPRLVTAAATNFSIPLDSAILLQRFSAGNLSCVSENALVTYDGERNRVGNADDIVTATATSAAAQVTAAKRYLTTVNGIVADVSVTLGTASQASILPSTTILTTTQTTTTTTPSVSAASEAASSTASAKAATTSSKASSSKTSSSAAASSTSANFEVTETVLDFARIATLYVLQMDDLATATAAQTALQHFFTNADSTATSAGKNVTLGSTITIDLVDYAINLGDGLGDIGALKNTKRSFL